MLASSLISFLLMFHSCSLPFRGPRSTTATLQGLQASSTVSITSLAPWGTTTALEG